MNIEAYMEKYAKIAGMEKTGKVYFKRKKKHKDPGYIFLNSGQFVKLRTPRQTIRKPTTIPPEVKPILDMFDRPVGPEEIYR